MSEKRESEAGGRAIREKHGKRRMGESESLGWEGAPLPTTTAENTSSDPINSYD
jgi:hypothetical protein